jgi:hypothetical protein
MHLTGSDMNTENTEPGKEAMASAMSSAAIARRHMLLKGLSKGTAVLAATVPLQTLASGSVFTSGKSAPVVRCSISGMTSGVSSRETTTSVCSGYSPGYYSKREHWPLALQSQGVPEWSCDRVFKKCSLINQNYRSGKPVTLLDVMRHTPRVDEFHWIAAWVNAMGGGRNFPYTGQQVVDFYNGHGPYSAEKALEFFKTYMEDL